jgi:hypothetical protein
MKTYYYIYRVGYGKPTIKHATLKQAALESERLAGQHPGETFEILKCLGITRTTTPQTFWNDGVIPPSMEMISHYCPTCGRHVPCRHCEPNAQGQTTAACASKKHHTASSPSSEPTC